MQKSILAVVLVLALSQVQAKQESQLMNFQSDFLQAIDNQIILEAIDFLGGLSLAIIQEDIRAELKDCYNYGEDFVFELSHAIHDFEIGGILGITAGIMRIINTVKDLPLTFNACKATAFGIEHFVQWAETQLADVTALELKITKNFALHSKAVIKDINDGLAFAQAGDFYNSGLKIGGAIAILTK